MDSGFLCGDCLDSPCGCKDRSKLPNCPTEYTLRYPPIQEGGSHTGFAGNVTVSPYLPPTEDKRDRIISLLEEIKKLLKEK